MLKFRTPIELESYSDHISYEDEILAIGSCFAENISSRLSDMLYSATSNPNGVLYNPISISQSMTMALNDYKFSEKDIIDDQGLFHSLYHHSSHSQSDSRTLIDQIQQGQVQLKEDILNAKWIILTFGSSWAYRYNENGQIVANCHRIPSRFFHREWLDLDEIVINYKDLIHQIRKSNPTVSYIFTVSPVRHLKDGLVENQRSKSNLILLCHQLTTLDKVFYFPSYEIVMDDLRDYRFFDRDLCHPNEMAVDYIWDLFSAYLLDSKEQSIRQEVAQIVSTSKHRPRFKDSQQHKMLCQKMIARLDRLQGKVNDKKRLKLIRHFEQSIDH